MMSAPSNAPHIALETAALRRAGEREKIWRSAYVTPAMRGVSKPNNIPARLAIMITLRCALPTIDLSLMRVGGLRRLLGIRKTSYCGVSAMSFCLCVTL
jgi:hypothetical protein